MVGGGRIFGPQPRDYSFKLNKKTKQLARKGALTYKAKENNIIVVEDFSFEAPKTKEYVNFLNNLKISDKKSVLALSEANKNVYLSARNLSKAEVVNVSELNTYKIMDAKTVIFTVSALTNIEQTLNA